jgi:hypothetical protein
MNEEGLKEFLNGGIKDGELVSQDTIEELSNGKGEDDEQ